MKKFLLAIVALAALGATAPAHGADLGARPYYNKAPAYVGPLYNWTGFYLGGHLGGAFSSSNTFNGLVLSDYSARLMGGVQAGADYQFAPNWVVGAEGQYSWLGKNNLTAVFPNGNYRSQWYTIDRDRAAFAAVGIHGQWIYVDPAAEMVIVRVSSQPTPMDIALDHMWLRGYRAITNHLANQQ